MLELMLTYFKDHLHANNKQILIKILLAAISRSIYSRAAKKNSTIEE